MFGISSTKKYPELPERERAEHILRDEQDQNVRLRAELYEARREIQRLSHLLRLKSFNSPI